MAKIDPEIVAHLEWLGFVQPTGLVVSAPALVRAGAILDRRDVEGQQLLRACLDGGVTGATSVRERSRPPYGAADQQPTAAIRDFRAFAERVLGWNFSPNAYAGTSENPIPAELEVALPDYGETLRPDFAVRELEPREGAPLWQLLVRVLVSGTDFDLVAGNGGQLEASAHGRMERLLRQTGVPAGLLFNGQVLRLISAPRGESSGWLDFRVAEMAQTAGRPIATAMRLLLSQERLLALPRAQRLPALLEESRRFQNEVSERLAEQVLHALYELLRGFQAAHDASRGELLREVLARDPNEVYRALLTVILRLVFLLYAEERDMLPEDETYLRYYSLGGLYEQLRQDAALFPDTMDQRYGAWPQLLVLFRLIYDGADAGTMKLPQRHGVLFDPERFRFLEGRSESGTYHTPESIEPPLVPDGTVYRALEKLLILDGERISYRALDVEQIGSVYETMMGFRLEIATGRSVAIKSQKKHGAPTAVDLEVLLTEQFGNRDKRLQDQADRKLTDTVRKSVAEAVSLEDLHAALLPVIDQAATPDLVPQGAMVLQPSEERRRSGSHYTPRELTGPIVRTTLDPLLARLRPADGRSPRPEEILDLKVCDPAMGSGAFLVEACRYLGDALVEAWHVHGGAPAMPPDEDDVVFARRLVAQRCLYGVDRNPVAVDLAKMSLWLVTLAKDHSLTFVDHALHHGDSLVGLSRRQIEAFHWAADAPRFKPGFEAVRASEHLARVAVLRRRIREAGEGVSDRELRALWDEAQLELDNVRLLGDLAAAAWFEGEKPNEREVKRVAFAEAVVNRQAERHRCWLEKRRHADPPLAPFHWETELPEVFEREKPGFDAFVGNPPFMGGSKISSTQGDAYLAWLLATHPDSHGNGDLVAHFFRRAFSLTRPDGTIGLIATNTIGQGDTRSTGLGFICTHGGTIYRARRRVKWPGMAAVIVSIVHVAKGRWLGPCFIDDRGVETITAFLFHRGGHSTPSQLTESAGLSFTGMKIYGQGFIFDDTDSSGQVSTLAEMRWLISERPENKEVILPYIGGEEVNDSPIHAYHRYVISFFDREEAECRARWPELMTIVEERVRPERMRQKRAALRDRWWQYGEKRPALTAAISGLDRVLVCALHSKDLSFAFLSARAIFSHALAIFPLGTYATFCALQARPHEIWARFFGSSMKDDLRYTPSDCFETFPFPGNWEAHPALEAPGKAYYDFRAALMVRNSEGLTKTYNRFHDPEERDPEILKLRELHAAMDRAVLDVYGWRDLTPTCEFLLDYDIDEEEWGDKKKPWRYRWPDEVRDEVLGRLLEVNAECAAEEVRLGAAGERRQSKKTRVRKPKPTEMTGGLFS